MLSKIYVKPAIICINFPTEPSLMLLITPVLFLRRQVKICVLQAFFSQLTF